MLSRGGEDTGSRREVVLLGAGRRPAGRLRPATRPAVDVFRAADHRRRLTDPHLLGRLHGRRSGAPTVFRVPEPVRRRDAAAGAGRQLPRPLRRLGRRRPGVLPADRVLVAQAVGGHRGQEGVRGQPRRRHRPGARADGDVRLHRIHLVRGRLRRRTAAGPGHAHRHRPAAPAGRMRQVRAGAAAVLARRRDGGPDTGVGADPRRHDGHRGRLPDRPVGSGVRPRPRRTARRRHRRRGDAAVRRDHRLRQGRHQEGAGRVHDEPDRLHGARRRPRARRLRGRDHAPADPRLLQGRPVPRRGLGDARHGRRGEHAPLRRPAHPAADHVRHLRARLPRDHRRTAAGGLLLQGRNHRDRLRRGRQPRASCWAARRSSARASPRST